MAKESTATVAAPEEEADVREVRCSVSGMPIPTIPLWYADVKVKFVSDAARTRSGATRLAEAIVEEDADEEETEDNDGEISLEDAEGELAVEDIDIDLDETGDEESEEDAEV
ncbi:MAG: hypothetical protein QM758_25005 [Armatimonas sp.]